MQFLLITAAAASLSDAEVAENAGDNGIGHCFTGDLAQCGNRASNVKEVTTQVSEGAVDCGIIYTTDAFSAGLDTVDEATADMCGQVIYPAAVLKNSTHADEAKAFLDYLTTDEAGKVFESVGFTTLA